MRTRLTSWLPIRPAMLVAAGTLFASASANGQACRECGEYLLASDGNALDFKLTIYLWHFVDDDLDFVAGPDPITAFCDNDTKYEMTYRYTPTGSTCSSIQTMVASLLTEPSPTTPCCLWPTSVTFDCEDGWDGLPDDSCIPDYLGGILPDCTFPNPQGSATTVFIDQGPSGWELRLQYAFTGAPVDCETTISTSDDILLAKLELTGGEFDIGYCDGDDCVTTGIGQCDYNGDGVIDAQDAIDYVNDKAADADPALSETEERDLLLEYLNSCDMPNPCEAMKDGLEDIYVTPTQTEIDDFIDGLEPPTNQPDCIKACINGDPAPPDCDPGAEDGEDEDDCGNGGGANTTSSNPVDYAYGYKKERPVGFSVNLPGGNFRLQHVYRSNKWGDSAIAGAGWTLRAADFLTDDPTAASADRKPELYDGNRKHVFEYDGSSKWIRPGSTSQYMVKATIDDPGLSTNTAVWRLTEPGRWECDFYRAKEGSENERAGYEGLIRFKRDVYGTEWTYSYDDFSSDFDQIRLDEVMVSSPIGGTMTNVAKIELDYETGGSSDNQGKITQVRAYRWDTTINLSGSPPGDWVLIERCSYTYKESSDSLSDAVGTPGDLVQVVRETVVDDTEESGVTDPMRIRVTQYRYHGGDANESFGSDTDGDGFIERGYAHQLKMVIEPEQIEFYAQERVSDTMSPADDHIDAAEELLLLDDDAVAGTTYNVSDMASKIIAQYDLLTGRVREQYLQTACGCGGGGLQGLKQVFSYFQHDDTTYTSSTRIEEYTASPSNAGYYNVYRTMYYVMGNPTGSRVPYLLYEATRSDIPGDTANGWQRTWVTGYDYDTTGNLTHVFTPEIVSDLEWDNDSGSLPLPDSDGEVPADYYDEADGRSGLVHRYSYNSKNRLFRRGVKDNSNGTERWQEQFSYDATRPWLVTRHRLYRTDPPALSDPDKQEDTLYSYDFHMDGMTETDAVAVRISSVETNLDTENGPDTAGFFSTTSIYDEQGLLTHQVSADDAITKYDYDGYSGQQTSVTRNWDMDSDASWYNSYTLTVNGSSLDTSGWGARSSGAADELATSYTYDLLGRMTSVTGPGGITTYTVREMRYEDVERKELPYYAEISLPHKISTGVFGGPGTVTWMNADGDEIRRSDFEVDSFTDRTTYDLDEDNNERARSITFHHLTGLVEKARVWHDSSSASGYYETSYEYDTLGRRTSVTNDNGTVNESVYDVMSRVIEEQIGVSTSTDRFTTTRYIYDIDAGAQGVGNGNLGRVQRFEEGTASRDTDFHYDYRDRMIYVENPLPPHRQLTHDHQDRVVREVLFDDDIPGPSDPNPPSTTRGRITQTDYSQRGLVYRTAIAEDPTVADASLKFLETHTWHDEVGRVVGQWAPTSPIVKTTYDAHGRVLASYTTARDGDARPGNTDNWEHVYTEGPTFAANVGNDTVLEQTEYRYIAGNASIGAGLVDLVTSRRRTHTSSSTGALGANNGAITSYQGTYYDDAHRVTHSAAYGTNTTGFKHSGSAPTITQGSPPSPDPGVELIIAETEYDAIGLVDKKLSPRTQDVGGNDVPYETKFVYDDLYRQVAVIENYDNASVSWDGTEGRWTVSGIADLEPDTDRVTSFVYDGSGNITKRVAHIPAGTNEDAQVTAYDYGYVRDDSGMIILRSNDLLDEVSYPDETTGEAGTTSEYKVSYEYNLQFEVTETKNQNGTVHRYTYDELGRITQDLVPPGMFGSNIDQWADRIIYEYDDGRRGLLESVQTKDGGGSNDVLNEIVYEYDELWQLTKIWMNPLGEVDTVSPSAATRSYAYIYETEEFDTGAAGGATHNYTRLDYIDYGKIASESALNQLNVWSVYGASANDVDDRISRATGLEFNINNAVANHSVEQQYVGLGMPVLIDYPTPDFQLTRYTDPDYDGTLGTVDDTTAGVYPGLDRFGRVVRHVWHDRRAGWDPDAIPPIYDLKYTYDNGSNILERTDAREGGYLNGRDEDYLLDGLDRLVDASRVEGTSTTDRALSQTWTLDMLGNWGAHSPDTTVSTLDQTRNHNQANEIDDITANSTLWEAFTYDDAGNMTVQGTSDTTRRTFTWDAWNRLTGVKYETKSGTWSGDYRTRHAYYPGHQRAWAVGDEDFDGDPDRWNLFFYDRSWRLLEHRFDDDVSAEDWDHWDDPEHVDWPTFDDDEGKQYVWGLNYIDELVYFRKGLSDGRYALCDRNYSVIALLEDDAGDADDERMRYTPYGEVRTTLRSDVDQNGTVESSGSPSDRLVINGASGEDIGDANYRVEADLNRDGTIDTNDSGLVTADNGESIAAGVLSEHGCLVGYNGYIHDPATGDYCVRYRWYVPGLGRWAKRDPAGYVDGAALYEATRSNPLVYLDPSGSVTLRGPEAAIIAWVKPFDPMKAASDATIDDMGDLPRWWDVPGQVWRKARLIEYSAIMAGLNSLANPWGVPNGLAKWNGPQVWGSKGHRGYVYLRPEVCCSDGEVKTTKFATSGASGGYTPWITGHLSGKIHPRVNGTPRVANLGNCARFSISIASRIDDWLSTATQYVLTHNGIPYINKTVTVKACCDGRMDVDYSSTHFPSHAFYLGGKRVGQNIQSDPGRFMYSGPGIAAESKYHEEQVSLEVVD